MLVNRYPNVIFFLPAAQPYLEMFKKNSNVICEVNRFKDHRFLDDFNGYDFAISIGGSLYQTHHIEGSFKRDADFFDRFIAAGKPIFIIGSNFDRDYGNAARNEKSFRDLFARGGNLLKVSLRDTHSYNFFRDLKNVTYAPDVVFGLSDNFSVPEDRRSGLGISVISTTLLARKGTLEKFHGQYIDGMISLVKSAVKKNIDVKIFSFCLREEDAKAVNEIAQGLTDAERARVQHVPYNGDIEKFLRLFASMKYIVAARFHANVFALKFRQNLFPIVYNDKTLNLLEDLKIFSAEEFFDLRGDKSLDIKKVWRMLEHPKKLDSKITAWTAAADMHFRELDKYLLRQIH